MQLWELNYKLKNWDCPVHGEGGYEPVICTSCLTIRCPICTPKPCMCDLNRILGQL